MHASYPCCDGTVGQAHAGDCKGSHYPDETKGPGTPPDAWMPRHLRRVAQRAQEKQLKKENNALRLEISRLRGGVGHA